MRILLALHFYELLSLLEQYFYTYHPNLKLSIGDTLVDDNVFADNSGNNNKSFSVSDYKPNFDKETFEIKKVTRTGRLRTDKKNRAF